MLALAGLIVVAVFTTVCLVVPTAFHKSRLPPANQSATPVGNGFPVAQQLWPPGFESSVVSSVNVSHSVLEDGYRLEGNVTFYEEECSKVPVDELLLFPVQTTLLTVAYSRTSVNYLGSDFPLYVSGGNSSLEYTVTASATVNNKTTGCALQIYLYNSSSSFSVFKDGLSPDDSYGEFVAKSECLPVGSFGEPETNTTAFNLSSESLYYIGAAIHANVNVSINISGRLLEYNVSKLRASDCFISPTTKSCTVQISSHAGNACVLYESDNPFDTLVLFFDTQTVFWNGRSVICLVFLVVSVALCVLIITSFFLYCCWKRKKTTSHGYQNLDVAVSTEEVSNQRGEQV